MSAGSGSGIVDLSESASVGMNVLERSLILQAPQSRLRLRLPAGKAGRAEAVFDGRCWAAKHYWQESDSVVVYEFDEPLPAGPVILRISLSRS